MTLADVTLPVTYEWGQQYGILFNAALAARLAELHAQYGRPDCFPIPLATTDGRFFLQADILTATDPGGYLHAMWEAADKSILLPAVEVLPIADALALLPADASP